MQVLVLSEGKGGELGAVNAVRRMAREGGKFREKALRKIEPRRLKDGRLILNADVLGDESAGDWHEPLRDAEVAAVTEEELKDEG